MAGTTGDIDVFEFADVEFGGVDVENAVPILRANDPGDRAIVFSNTYLEQPEIQRYTGRDHRLFEFYMSAAYQMRESQIAHIQIDSTETWRISCLNSPIPTPQAFSMSIFQEKPI